MNIILGFVIITDISIGAVGTMIKMTSPIYSTLFVILVVLFIVTTPFMLISIKIRNAEIIRKGHFIQIANNAVTFSQYFLNAVLLLIAFQIVSNSSYFTNVLLLGSVISYGASIFVMAILTILFFLWYRQNKSFNILMYGSATLSAIASLLFIAVLTLYILPGLSTDRNAASFTNQFDFSDATRGSLVYLAALYNAISFLLFWTSTIILLKHYSRKIGKAKFWPLMSIPIISFVIQYTIITPILASTATTNNTSNNNNYLEVDYVTILGSVFPVISGGLLYGIPFFITSRKINQEKTLRKYLVIAAVGSIFFQLTGSGQSYSAPYPPFGFVTLALTPLACYLLMIGIYSSSISISSDARLRREIRKYAMEEAKLIGDIGLANISQSIENKVLEFAKKETENLVEEKGIYPSMSDEEVQEYMVLVMKEVKQAHIKNNRIGETPDSKRDSLT
jgi:hypothetical protein